MHKSQIFFYLLLSFLLGVSASSFLDIPKIFWLAALNFSFIFIIFFWPMRTSSRFAKIKIRKWKYVFYTFLVIFFLFGGLRTSYYKFSHSILSEFADKELPLSVTLKGYINSEVESLGNRQQFIFLAKDFELPDIKTKISEKVLITAPPYPEYNYGDELEINGEIKLPKNFNDFDYKSFLGRDHIFTIMQFPAISESDIKINFSEKVKNIIFEKIFLVKKSFEESVQKSINEPGATLVNGVLLGTKKTIPEDIKEDFSKTGLSHILAISGYNITMVAMIISWLFLLFFSRRMSFWFSVVAILVFTVLTGALASVTRAAIMGLLVLLAKNSGRIYDSKNALILAAAIMIWFNPLSLRFDVGLQLSFLATIGILYVTPILEPYVQKFPKFFNLRETFLMTVSAQIMVLPLILFYFHNLSLISIPANLVILPLVPFIMLFGFLSGLGGLFSDFIGLGIGFIAWIAASFQLFLIKLFASVPFAVFKINLHLYGAIILYGAIFYTLYVLKNKKKEGIGKQ